MYAPIWSYICHAKCNICPHVFTAHLINHPTVSYNPLLIFEHRFYHEMIHAPIWPDSDTAFVAVEYRIGPRSDRAIFRSNPPQIGLAPVWWMSKPHVATLVLVAVDAECYGSKNRKMHPLWVLWYPDESWRHPSILDIFFMRQTGGVSRVGGQQTYKKGVRNTKKTCMFPVYFLYKYKTVTRIKNRCKQL